MGLVCGQSLKSKYIESKPSKQLNKLRTHEYENVELDDQDQLFQPSLTKNYILNPRFLFKQQFKLEKEEQHMITQFEQNSSQQSFGIQSELNNINETQVKQKNQNKLKPDIQNNKRMSLEQRYKIAISPSMKKKQYGNTVKSPLEKISGGKNHSAKYKQQIILQKGKRNLSNKDEQLN